MVLVRLYAAFRPRAGGAGSVEVPWAPGDTVGDVMWGLLRRYPELDGYILNGEGNLVRFVNIFLDGRDIRYLDGLESRVDRDSELSVFPPVAGG